MSNEEQSIKGKIILSTITCMERDGIQDVTIRNIAQEADVNIASINYHFGTKDNLIQIALQSTLDHMFGDIEDVFKNKDFPNLEKRIRDFLKYMLEGSLRFPNITKAHLYDTFFNNKYDTIFIKRFNEFLNQTVMPYFSAYSEKKIQQVKITLSLFVYSIISIGIAPKMLFDFNKIDFSDENYREQFIEHLLKMINLK